MHGTKNKLILAFDSWTQGAHHLDRLVPAFEECGLRLLLVHIGSWGHDPDRPKEEQIGRLQARDISYYGEANFQDVLRIERPAGVIFLSTRAFAHQAFNRYAVADKIPTFHLLHGLVNVQDVGRITEGRNLKGLAAMLAERAGKNLFKLLPTYIRAMVVTRASRRVWRELATEILGKVRADIDFHVAPLDSTTTAGFAYTDADVPFLRDAYRVPEDRIFVVGLPDITRFGLAEDDFGRGLRERTATSNEVVYIDAALIDAGLSFTGADDFVDHLLRTSKKLAEQGYSFVVKLHPAHFRTGVTAMLESAGIALCGNDEIVQRLRSAAAAISEPSTAAMMPALMGKPLLLARYEKLHGQHFGKVLTDYPLAREIEDIDQAGKLIEECLAARDPASFDVWMKRNAGPLPAEDMPLRVARGVTRVLEEEGVDV